MKLILCLVIICSSIFILNHSAAFAYSRHFHHHRPHHHHHPANTNNKAYNQILRYLAHESTAGKSCAGIRFYSENKAKSNKNNPYMIICGAALKSPHAK